MKKILIIEDEKNLAENIKEFLSEEGFIVEVADDGYEGIKKANKFLPDIIVSDINLPKKDGYEVLEEISKNEKLCKVPFIYLTGKVEKEDLRKGMLLGADDYIFKPFKLDDLLHSINVRLKKIDVIQFSSKLNLRDEKLSPDDKVFVKFNKQIQVISVKDIKYIKAQNPYVLLKCKSNKTALIRESIKKWEEKLPEKLFMRIHRNTIVNLDCIVKIEKFSKTNYLIKLADEAEPFFISKRFASRLISLKII